MISECPPARADTLVPLNLQVQALHSAVHPNQHVVDPDPKAVAEFLKGLLTSGMTALIAGKPDAPTGYILYDIEDRPANALRPRDTRAMLHHICVDETARRQGVGFALISAMLERLKDTGVTRIVVSYAIFNSASAALMAKAGFDAQYIIASRPL